jgi:hypothetical protein
MACEGALRLLRVARVSRIRPVVKSQRSLEIHNRQFNNEGCLNAQVKRGARSAWRLVECYGKKLCEYCADYHQTHHLRALSIRPPVSDARSSHYFHII